MRIGHGGDSRNCADFASGFALRMPHRRSGELEWRDVDFDAGEIVVRGDALPAQKIGNCAVFR